MSVKIGEGCGDFGSGFVCAVVANPGLEKVAEDVKRFRPHRFIAHEIDKQLRNLWAAGVEMQIGDEERGHDNAVLEPAIVSVEFMLPSLRYANQARARTRWCCA